MADIKVSIISHTKEPEKIITAAAKLCYSPSQIDDLMNNLTDENIEKFISMLSDLGHESPFEHVSYTFAIEGISRVTEQQFTRHRLASYSIQSGRYVGRYTAKFAMPPSIEEIAAAEELYSQAMRDAQYYYDGLVHILKGNYLKNGMKDKDAERKAVEDARYVFPNSLKTRMIVTMNVRNLWNFFTHRCCNRAQWEIRQVAKLMLTLCKEISPLLFKYSGPACIKGLGCPENSMQCTELKGKIPTQNEIKELIRKYYRIEK